MENEIKEWHFHVYFFQDDKESLTQALRLNQEICRRVAAGKLLAVCHNVCEIPGFEGLLDVNDIPPIHLAPRGPHPCESFECWVPIEGFAQAWSFFAQHRGHCSILLHPLTIGRSRGNGDVDGKTIPARNGGSVKTQSR